MKETKRNIIMAVVVLAVAVVLLFMTEKIVPLVQTEEVGPKFVPRLVAAALALLAALQLITSSIRLFREKRLIASGEIVLPPDERDPAKGMPLWRKICDKYGHWVVWTVMLISVVLMHQIGFIISSIIIMFVTTYMMAPRDEINLPVFIAVSVALPIALYFIFVKVFYLMLPVGMLWKNLGIL